MIKVSIIIPVYNAQAYLSDCLDSVLKQSLKELEVICIDDGSKDKSLSILREYQNNDPRIVVISQNNQGSGPARNRGIDLSKGEFIAFMDADDYYVDPVALERMYDACQVHDIDVCGSLRCLATSNYTRPYPIYSEEYMNNPKGTILYYQDYQMDFFYQSYIFRKRLLDEHDIRFPPLLRYQDPPFFVKAMYIAARFCIVPKELYCYRWGHQKLDLNNAQINDLLSGLMMNLEFSSKNGLDIIHRTTVKRLNTDYCKILLAGIRPGNLSLFQRLVDANNLVNHKMLGEEIHNTSLDCLLTPLQLIINFTQNKPIKEKSSNGATYLFPFNEVTPHSNVAIYAAGNVGKQFYRQIVHSGYCRITAWVDRQWEKLKSEGIDVCAPEQLSSIFFDFIIIAVENSNIADDIRIYLNKMGISNDKIIWMDYMMNPHNIINNVK